MEVGSRVTVTPKDYHKLPEGHSGCGTVREVQPAEMADLGNMHWVDLDGLPEWQWDWFFDEELAEVTGPTSRIGDTDVCPSI